MDFFVIIDENKVEAGERGAIDIILNVMKKHISIINVCELSCKVIWNITFNNSKDNKNKA